LPGSQDMLDQLAQAGISMGEVTHRLEFEGVKSFADSFEQLIATTKEKAARLQRAAASDGETTGDATPAVPRSQGATFGALQGVVDATLERADQERFAARIWDKDPQLWKSNPDEQQEIADRLGWLSVTEQMADVLPRLNDLRDDVRQAGFTHA